MIPRPGVQKGGVREGGEDRGDVGRKRLAVGRGYHPKVQKRGSGKKVEGAGALGFGAR